MKHAIILVIAITLISACVIAALTPEPEIPQPTIELTSQVADTNQTQDTSIDASVQLFSGQQFSLTNCVLKNTSGDRYGGSTNYRITITIGNTTDGTKNWQVYGDGTTNYTGNDGAWVNATTSYWVNGLYIPTSYTNTVYMQVKAIHTNGNTFIYPLTGLKYFTPLQ